MNAVFTAGKVGNAFIIVSGGYAQGELYKSFTVSYRLISMADPTFVRTSLNARIGRHHVFVEDPSKVLLMDKFNPGIGFANISFAEAHREQARNSVRSSLGHFSMSDVMDSLLYAAVLEEIEKILTQTLVQ